MKKTLFILIILAVMASSYGVYSYFNKFNRARNANMVKPVLVIYTNSSFMNPFGPGPLIAQEFKKICLCDIQYVDGGGGQVLIQKLKMNKAIDVVLGLDQIDLKEAAKYIKWNDLKPTNRNWNDVFLKNTYKTFLPYDWSPVSLVYKDTRKIESAKNLRSLLGALPDNSLSLQDPRQSNLGLQLVYWAFVESGQDLDKMAELAKLVAIKTKKVSSDWSAAYGLFKRGQSSFVLSYLTSPLYHIKAENDFSYGSTVVQAGHPVQIEYAAVPKACRSCGLGKRFVEFMSSDFVQKTLYEKNYMLPVVNGILSDQEESKTPKVKALDTKALDNFVDQRKEILERWTQAQN